MEKSSVVRPEKVSGRIAGFSMAVMTVTRQEKGREKDKRIRGKTAKRNSSLTKFLEALEGRGFKRSRAPL